MAGEDRCRDPFTIVRTSANARLDVDASRQIWPPMWRRQQWPCQKTCKTTVTSSRMGIPDTEGHTSWSSIAFVGRSITYPSYDELSKGSFQPDKEIDCGVHSRVRDDCAPANPGCNASLKSGDLTKSLAVQNRPKGERSKFVIVPGRNRQNQDPVIAAGDRGGWCSNSDPSSPLMRRY